MSRRNSFPIVTRGPPARRRPAPRQPTAFPLGPTGPIDRN